MGYTHSYIVWPFHTCRYSAIPNSHQSTQLPCWPVLLPPTRGLHWSRTAVWWGPRLSQRRGWNRLSSSRQRHYPVRQVKGIIVICGCGGNGSTYFNIWWIMLLWMLLLTFCLISVYQALLSFFVVCFIHCNVIVLNSSCYRDRVGYCVQG